MVLFTVYRKRNTSFYSNRTYIVMYINMLVKNDTNIFTDTSLQSICTKTKNTMNLLQYIKTIHLKFSNDKHLFLSFSFVTSETVAIRRL